MTNQWAFLDIYENCWLAGKMLTTNIKNIVSYSNSEDKVKIFFSRSSLQDILVLL